MYDYLSNCWHIPSQTNLVYEHWKPLRHLLRIVVLLKSSKSANYEFMSEPIVLSFFAFIYPRLLPFRLTFNSPEEKTPAKQQTKKQRTKRNVFMTTTSQHARHTEPEQLFRKIIFGGGMKNLAIINMVISDQCLVRVGIFMFLTSFTPHDSQLVFVQMNEYSTWRRKYSGLLYLYFTV